MQGLDTLYDNLTPWNSIKAPSAMSAREEVHIGSRGKACSSLWGETKRIYLKETGQDNCVVTGSRQNGLTVRACRWLTACRLLWLQQNKACPSLAPKTV